MKTITLVAITMFVTIVGMMIFLHFAYPPVVSLPASVVPAAIIPSPTSAGAGGPTNTGTQAGAEPLTAATIAKHTTPNDCYLLVKGKVYDVSSYISQHPGGRREITSKCGQEVTGVFTSIHSNFAWDLLGKYQIGVVSL